jgi:hypothetical protein
MSQYQVHSKLLTGMIRHNTDVSLQYSKTDDRIFDFHEISQTESNRYGQKRTDPNPNEHNRTEPMTIRDFSDYND